MENNKALSHLVTGGYLKSATDHETFVSALDGSGNIFMFYTDEAEQELSQCEQDVSVMLELLGLHADDPYRMGEHMLKTECSIRLIRIIANKVRERWAIANGIQNAIQPSLELIQ